MNTKTGHETGAKLAAAISVCEIRAICGKNSVIPQPVPSHSELLRVIPSSKGGPRDVPALGNPATGQVGQESGKFQPPRTSGGLLLRGPTVLRFGPIRAIPSYYELFRVQKRSERGTSRPAAWPGTPGRELPCMVRNQN